VERYEQSLTAERGSAQNQIRQALEAADQQQKALERSSPREPPGMIDAKWSNQEKVLQSSGRKKKPPLLRIKSPIST